jgi:hypothetical protein
MTQIVNVIKNKKIIKAWSCYDLQQRCMSLHGNGLSTQRRLLPTLAIPRDAQAQRRCMGNSKRNVE